MQRSPGSSAGNKKDRLQQEGCILLQCTVMLDAYVRVKPINLRLKPEVHML